MAFAEPPFRAEHVGSLLRPQPLLDAREPYDEDEFADYVLKPKPAALIAAEDAAIRDAVAMQERIGLKTITDGEFRRRSWFIDFLIGFGPYVRVSWKGGPTQFVDTSGSTRPSPQIYVDETLVWTRPIMLDDFRFLQRCAAGTPKITLPSPLLIHFYGGRHTVSETAYPEMAAFWDDVVVAWRAEIAALAEAGCAHVQIDETNLVRLCDPRHRALLEERYGDLKAVEDHYIRVLGGIFRDPPAGTRLSMHICRGNSRGHWMAEGAYDTIAERLLAELPVTSYYLEYDSPRAGGFAPLRFLPEGKRVVLGLVTTKTPGLESADALRRRIDEAARYTPLDRLALSPQCGFASSKGGNPVTLDDQERKLARVVEVAESVWGSA